MAITEILIGFALLSGIMASLLIILGLHFEKDKKKSRNLLIWSALFLAASFAVSEYAFWNEGSNLFNLVFSFNFPLIVFFTIWFAFYIWIFEMRKERKIWIILMILLLITIAIAMICMNCVRF